MAKRRRQIRDYEALIARQARSGLSVSAFAKREGVPQSTLARWKRRLVGAKTTRTTARSRPQSLLPVRVSSLPVVRVDPEPIAEFEVRLRSGHELCSSPVPLPP